MMTVVGKIRFGLLVVVWLQLPLLHARPFVTTAAALKQEPNAADKEMPNELTVTLGLKRLVSAVRKGAIGGHGGGGHVGGHGGRGIGGKHSGDEATHSDATVVPIIAGKGGHRGTNNGTHRSEGSIALVWLLIIFQYLV